MCTTKELERAELHKTIWHIANDLRGSSDHFARLVENGEIAANGYNIAVSSYVEQANTTEAVDIHALNAEISRIVARQTELREQIDAIVADLEGTKETVGD